MDCSCFPRNGFLNLQLKTCISHYMPFLDEEIDLGKKSHLSENYYSENYVTLASMPTILIPCYFPRSLHYSSSIPLSGHQRGDGLNPFS